jgi:hypothetical protein
LRNPLQETNKTWNPSKETVEKEGREGAGWIKSKQRERLGKRSRQQQETV